MWRTFDQLDFPRLQQYLSKVQPLPLRKSMVGYASSNYFFQYHRLSTAGSDKTKSCVEMWGSNKPTDYKEKDAQGYMVYLYKAPAQFPPSIAGMMYKYFTAKHVLDPFAGWGDRCVAAIALGIKYTGIDTNTKLQSAYEMMIAKYGGDVKMIFEPNQKVDIDPLSYDLLFSSPPFWNKRRYLVEKYNNCESNYDKFMKECLLPLLNKCRVIRICLHLPELMYIDVAKEFKECDRIFSWSSGGSRNNNNIYCWDPLP